MLCLILEYISLYVSLTMGAAKCIIFSIIIACALIKSPLDRSRTPTKRFVKSSDMRRLVGRCRRILYNAKADWLRGYSALFFSRLFPVWVNGSSCYRLRRSWHRAAIRGELYHHGGEKKR